MNSTLNLPDDCHQLLSALVDGTISLPEREQLAQQLAVSEDARVRYFEYVVLHAQLTRKLRPPGVLPNLTVLDLPVRKGFGQRFQPVVAGSRIWVTLAVGMVFAAYVTAITWNMLGKRELGDEPQLPDHLHSVATITAVSEVRWSADSAASLAADNRKNGDGEGLVITPGVPLLIDSGLVELHLKQGATLLIEGPAEWSIDGVNAATLNRGKVVAKVPHAAVGFKLQTPGARIVDLGTEFGVVVAQNQETEVQVFQGRVSLRTSGKNIGVPSSRILVAGESTTIVAGAEPGQFVLRDVQGKPTALSRKLPAPKSKPAPSYPDSLVAYWNFDEQNDEGICWDVCGSNHATLVDVKRVAGLAGKGAVEFSNTDGQVVRLPAQASGLNFGEGITIELLFTSNWSGAPFDYDELMRAEGSFTFSFQNDHNDAIDGPVLALEVRTTKGSVNLDMPLDGQEGRPTLAELTDGKPHHAVATGDATTGEFAIYLDGKKCFSQILTPGATVQLAGDSTPQIGNFSGNLEEPFSGTLDEVALYAAALPAEQIAEHWAQSRVGECYFKTCSGKVLRNVESSAGTGAEIGQP